MCHRNSTLTELTNKQNMIILRQWDVSLPPSKLKLQIYPVSYWYWPYLSKNSLYLSQERTYQTYLVILGLFVVSLGLVVVKGTLYYLSPRMHSLVHRMCFRLMVFIPARFGQIKSGLIIISIDIQHCSAVCVVVVGRLLSDGVSQAA